MTKWYWGVVFLALSVQGAIKVPSGESFSEEQLGYIARCFGDNFDMVEHIESKKLLTAAWDAASGRSYCITLPGADDFFPQSAVVFFRHVTADGFVFKRAEVYDGKSPKKIFLQNREGQFGICGKIAWEIMDISLLSQFELISTPLPPVDMLYYAYSMTSARYQGRPCIKVTGRLSSNQDDWHSVAKVSPDQIRDRKSEFYTKRPFVREYLIDEDSLVIYSRTDYNARKKKIFQQTLGDVTFETLSDTTLFDSPRKISGKVLFRQDFENKLLDVSRPSSSSPILPAMKSLFTRILDYSLQYGGYFFATLAVVLLAIAVSLKIAGRKYTR